MLSRSWLDRDNAVALAVTAVALPSLALSGASGPARWPGVGVCLVAAVALLAFLVPAIQERVGREVLRRPSLAWSVPLGFALYGAGATLLVGSGDLIAVAAWPACVVGAFLAVAPGRDEEIPAGRLLAAGLSLAILAGVWDRALQIRVPGDARLGLAYLCCIGLALFLFSIAHPRRPIDVRLGLCARDLLIALVAVVVLAAAAVPVGLWLGLLRWEPRWLGAGYGLARLFGLVVFVGLPEELLFRGVFQNALARLTTPRAGWVLASVIFGLTHLAKHFPPPNWPYAALATAAGLAYGWVYLRTGRVAAAALAHGLVNWIWGTWLGA